MPQEMRTCCWEIKGTRLVCLSFCLCQRHGQFGYFFFFQAEDGIRDLYVTGVQTCALPISPFRAPEWDTVARRLVASGCPRSEERRVGKECSALGPPGHLNKINPIRYT